MRRPMAGQKNTAALGGAGIAGGASPSVSHLLAGLLAALLSGCARDETPLPPPGTSRPLVVLMRPGLTTFYEDPQGGHTGLEYELIQRFAARHGYSLQILLAPQFGDVLPLVARGGVHLAAAGIEMRPEWESRVNFGPAYQRVTHQLVYNTGRRSKPRALADLRGWKCAVVEGRGGVEALEQARERHPELVWTQVTAEGSQELLEQVADGTLDAAVVPSDVAAVMRNFHPELRIAFNLGEPDYLGWALPKGTPEDFVIKVYQFFLEAQRAGTLDRLIDRYYGHLGRLESADVSGILARMNTTLPKYRRLFKQAQDETGLDWRFLAALAYQESKWDNFATSPTNVRGIMMLTGQTADHLGVSNRLDVHQAIPAAAGYIETLKGYLPDVVSEPDRTWIALAAYNVGYAHIEDALRLAERRGLNPHAWTDIKKVLPLLAQPKYRKHLKYGNARGGQAVVFAENVRTYYDILVKFQKPHTSPLRKQAADDDRPERADLKPPA